MPGFTANVDVSNLMNRMAAYSDQFPYAVAVALTKTAKDAQAEVKRQLPVVFNNPTRYTLNSTYITPAKKADAVPSAEVFFKTDAVRGTPAVKYIFPEVYGGQRYVKRFERALQLAGILPKGMVTVPGKGTSLDRYGNLSAGLINAMLSQLKANSDQYQNATDSKRSRRTRKVRGEFFVARPGSHLPEGIYLRSGSKLKSFVLFVASPTYKKRLPFESIIRGVFDERIGPNFDDALGRAIATARRP